MAKAVFSDFRFEKTAFYEEERNLSFAFAAKDYTASFGVIAAKTSSGNYFYIGTVKYRTDPFGNCSCKLHAFHMTDPDLSFCKAYLFKLGDDPVDHLSASAAFRNLFDGAGLACCSEDLYVHEADG